MSLSLFECIFVCMYTCHMADTRAPSLTRSLSLCDSRVLYYSLSRALLSRVLPLSRARTFTVSRSIAHTRARARTFACSLSRTLSVSFFYIHISTHHLSQSCLHAHTMFSFFVSLPLTHIHALFPISLFSTFSFFFSFASSFSLFFPFFLSFSHTHALFLPLSHAHILSLSVSPCLSQSLSLVMSRVHAHVLCLPPSLYLSCPRARKLAHKHLLSLALSFNFSDSLSLSTFLSLTVCVSLSLLSLSLPPSLSLSHTRHPGARLTFTLSSLSS